MQSISTGTSHFRTHLEDHVRLPKKVTVIDSVRNFFSEFRSIKSQDDLFKKLFQTLSLLLLIGMPILSFDYSITGDERFYKPHGEIVLDYYRGEKNIEDTYRIGGETIGSGGDIRFYGPFFDLVTAAINRYIGIFGEYETRHLLNSLYGFFILLFTALIAKEIGGWRMAFIALCLITVSPRVFGEGMNNPKDPIFSAGYIASVYFLIRFLKQLPVPKWSTVLLLALAIGSAISVRIGGLLLICYLLLFTTIFALINAESREKLFQSHNYKNLSSLALKLAMVSVIGYFWGILFWPYAISSPIKHPLEILDALTHSPEYIKTLFEGNKIWSTQVPWYYVIKWIAITVPVIVLVGVAALPFLSMKLKSIYDWRFIALVAFIGIFPIAYVIYHKSFFYNGWRHTTFVYPPFVVLAAVSFDCLFRLSKKKVFAYVFSGILVIGIVFPLQWMIRNHPHQSLYFNYLSGGVKKAYGKYDIDYFGITLREASEWLAKNVDLSDTTLKVVSNYSNVIPEYYINKKYPNVKAGYLRYKERNSTDWDYALFTLQLMEPPLLANFPPKGTIHQIKVDGVTVAAVVKHENKSDYYAYDAMRQNRTTDAFRYLQNAVKYDPKNEATIFTLKNYYMAVGNYDMAEKTMRRVIEMFPEYTDALNDLGNIYFKREDYDRAVVIYTRIIKRNPDYAAAYFNRGLSLVNLKKPDAALPDLNLAVKYASVFKKDAYTQIANIYRQKGNNAKADWYTQEAKKP